MKATFRDKYVPFAELRVAEIPMPVPKANEVLVRVAATTVNRTDCAVASGSPWVMRLFVGLSQPRVPVPGTDLAGEVVALGEEVKGFSLGQRVWAFQDDGLASQAEYAAIPVNKPILPMPEGIDYATAAASLEGAHYAINFINKVNLSPSKKVMLNGATGAIGSAALQFLKYYGASVTATCRGEDRNIVRALGADRVIDYTTEDFTKDADRYDFVFDSVGKSSFGKCKRLLNPKGVYISSELGPRWENPFLALLTPLGGGRRVAFPLPRDIPASMAFIRDRLQDGSFKPLIDRTFPLDQVADAYQYVASGQKKGNVVLDIAISPS